MPGNILDQLRIDKFNEVMPGTLCSNASTLSAEMLALADAVFLSAPSEFL